MMLLVVGLGPVAKSVGWFGQSLCRAHMGWAYPPWHGPQPTMGALH